MKKNENCPKCGCEEMLGGYPVGNMGYIPIFDHVIRWAREFLLFGLLAKNAKPIVMYRCKSCGYLESYAK